MSKEVVYMPYVLDCLGTYINGIKVWDKRWYINIFCKINWFFHFKERKRYKYWSTRQVNESYYAEVRYKNDNEETPSEVQDMPVSK